MAWVKCCQKIEVGVINSAEIRGNVHRKGYRKSIYTFCLDLGTFLLVSPLAFIFTWPGEGEGRAKVQRWTCNMDFFKNR